MAAFPPVPPPDPIGLIKVIASGVVMSGDPFFVLTMFTHIHYDAIAPVVEMFSMGELAIWELMVRMLHIATHGAVCGIALLWGMGSPILFPTHTIDTTRPAVTGVGPRRRLRIGIFFMSWSVRVAIVSTLQIMGVYTRHFPFGDDIGESDEAKLTVRLVGLVIGLALITWTIVETWRGTDASPMALAYYGTKATLSSGVMILMSGLFLVLVNTPQAIMDFASAPPTPALPLWATGLIAGTLELLIVLGFYFVMRQIFPDINTRAGMFGPANSGVSFGWWCIGIASIYLISNVVYIPLLSTVATTWTHVDWVTSGIAVLIALVGIAFFFMRRAEARGGKGYHHIAAQAVPAFAAATGARKAQGQKLQLA